MRFAFSIAVLVGTGVGAAQGPLDPAATFAQATRTQWDGIFTEAQATRGAPLFDEQCIVCHGGGIAPDLFGSGFNSRWDGSSMGELFSLVQTAMPQQQPGSLTSQQYTDIVAYLLHGGGFPAGQDPLQPDIDTLGLITFAATRPPAPPSGARDVTSMADDVFERLFTRMVGTWEFKADKSTYTRPDPPEGWVVIYERAGDRTVRYTNKTVAPDGSTNTRESTQVLDGQDYARPSSDVTIARMPVDEYTIIATVKNAGDVSSRNTQFFSTDGRRMTIIGRAYDDQGREYISNINVYDKID